ncbi:TetR family transcriptional regulator [Amycolatopsis sp. FBCC-B4732]|uniref:TetR/AcrR family transcriptional regulator n=1 Tax=Amycolatopsis sp. FBCC-B4732 TaxID=3079339 RepID=UPI001FF4CFB1|nr:TetR family transcriptional regulator [Amycolatopsis sp. FBCC-B4732]UOX89208.1 TetR family transcriptional regulator [Amycolatopsis sp. FBCC-B4732]
MTDRAQATRELILTVAERLYAEHGVLAVSNRQISEVAGQGNNTAVGYHFGTRADLVRAIARRHSARVEELRQGMLAELGGRAGLRDWVRCLVHPSTEYLATAGPPSWFARFTAQVMTEPSLRAVVAAETLSSPSLARTVEGLARCLPELPPDVRAERNAMTRQLLIHTMAERERALAEGGDTPRSTWREVATGLTDALAGLWLAPVTNHPRERNGHEGHRR